MQTFKTTSKLAIAACCFLALGVILAPISEVAWALPAGRGPAGTIAVLVAFGLAFVLGLGAAIHLIVCREDVKGWLLTALAILGSTPVVLLFVCVAIHARTRAAYFKHTYGEHNLRLLGGTLLEYARRTGEFPDPNSWCDSLMAFDSRRNRRDFQHPQREAQGLKGECSFCYNRFLAGRSAANVSPDTVLIFEADGAWNLNGAQEKLATRYRQHGCVLVMMADGRVGNYWFDDSSLREFAGGTTYYAGPRWQP